MSFKAIEVNGESIRIKKGSTVALCASGSILQTLTKIGCTKGTERIKIGANKVRVTVFLVSPFNVAKILEAIPNLEAELSYLRPKKKKKKRYVWKKTRTLDSRLFPYQRYGVSWLLNGQGGYLADEMGLGKTVQALQFLQNSPFTKALVVAPASVCLNWAEETREWATDWEPFFMKGRRSVENMLAMPADTTNTKIAYITTWAQLALSGPSIAALHPECLICDEAHRSKSLHSKRTQAALHIAKEAESVVLLSGTPMRNCAADLFPPLNMVAPHEFNDFNDFAQQFSPPRERTTPGGNTITVYDISTNLDQLREKSRPYILHRKKKDVNLELPPLRWRKLLLPANPSLEADWEDILDAFKSDDEFDTSDLIRHRIEVGVEKVKAVAPWIEDNASPENPLVVFIVHKSVRRELETQLHNRGISHAAIVGDTSTTNRQRYIRNFQQGKYAVLICSEAAKEGVTLTRASQLLQLERFWVPSDEEQAEARVHRIGSTNPVIITHAHMGRTFDDFIVAKLARKRSVIREVFGDTLMDSALANRLISKIKL